MDHFSFPSGYADQKAWADDLDIRLVDAQYHEFRKLAVRRTIFAGIAKAFVEIPELEIVTFSFNYNQKSIKDSINAFGGNLNADEDSKINKKFNKLMGSVRSRVGQDTGTWEGLSLFFRAGDRRLVRGQHEFFIEQIFHQDTVRWDEEHEARWQAQLLDKATPGSTAKQKSMRL